VANDTGSDVLGLLAGIVLIIYWPFWHFDIAPFSDTKTLHTQLCNGSNASDCRWRNASRRTYRVDKEGQSVVELTHANGQLEALTGCVVFNRNNWRCSALVGNQGFSKSEFLSPLPDWVRDVNKTRWWFGELLD